METFSTTSITTNISHKKSLTLKQRLLQNERRKHIRLKTRIQKMREDLAELEGISSEIYDNIIELSNEQNDDQFEENEGKGEDSNVDQSQEREIGIPIRHKGSNSSNSSNRSGSRSSQRVGVRQESRTELRSFSSSRGAVIEVGVSNPINIIISNHENL